MKGGATRKGRTIPCPTCGKPGEVVHASAGGKYMSCPDFKCPQTYGDTYAGDAPITSWYRKQARRRGPAVRQAGS